MTLGDDARRTVGLFIDSYREMRIWRQRGAARPLQYDYQAAALVGRVTAARPHGQLAAQVFLPDGPLALLPLPRPQELALVWSLPAAKAKALAAAPHEIVAHELDKATQNRFGALDPMGPLAAQDLHLSLAQHITDAAYVAIGDVAHVVHPLAGQGFNLTLRDGALLADSLYEARALGLPFDDASLLAQFARARHADAALTAATTHGLARLFQGPLAPLGRLGLGVVGRMVARRPSLRDTLTAQANGGVGDAPRLMRGLAFPQSGLK
jgi:2-polyprenyl-6-methoxyphenol hydroxylase-like FAD-dependent oxidoreductase